MTIEDRALDGAGPSSALHARQYLESNGAAVDHPAAGRLVLLYTTGRLSGEVRRTPLRYFEHDGDLLVAGSSRGSDHHPDWFLNLVADPKVWVRLNADLFPATALVVEEPDRKRVWESVILADAPQFADYQIKTDRTIPIVRIVADG